MALELYRRHNTLRCRTSSPTDSSCTNTRKPCPIWVRGTQADGTYVRQPLKLRDWKAAQKIVREWDEQGTRPKGVAPKATIEQLQKQFLENMKTEERAAGTIKKYEVLFRQLVAFSQNKGLRFVTELDLTTLEEFRATWKDGDLSKSKKQERLRGVFRYARKHKMIDDNPALDLGKITVEPGQVVPFTDAEMERIWKAAKADKNPRIYALALLMRFSGLRISDAVALRVDQVKVNRGKDGQIENGRVSLRTRKVKKDVSVPLPKPVLEALQKFKPVSSNHFFWNGQSDVIAVAGYYRDYYFHRVFKAAKITGHPHPHQFRHVFASKLLSSGVSVDQVAALLGNSSKVVEKHYSPWVKARQESLDDAVEKANGYHGLPEDDKPATNVIPLRRRGSRSR
jgi:site-specific recombinase XerD